ncbi:MAG: lysine biosynthesis protein LysX [Nitrososphaeria archaeon]|nr:lysine biosynthesis protein LysX [Aigarchaeota archaeon]MCX8188019.1 lysine biosynthesis protein LysX [Nitrososphaeria archaeon]MDW8021904.1 lysine biosynthesis protein LysX [Nitrososphaerota archaeon]
MLYDFVRWEERDLVRAARELGHEVKFIQVTKKPFWLTRPNEFKDLDFAIQRCVSFYRALASTMIFEEQGIPVVNSSQVILACEDKLYTTAKLARHGIPVPETAIALSREACFEAAEKLGYPVVVKPIYGSWGRMISRALDRESLGEILEFRENMQSPYFKVHYLQEYVKKPGRDIRAYYFWGEVPAAIYRVSEQWKTNTALGGKAVPAELSEEQIGLIRAAGEVMGGGILGVDLIEKGSESLVLEVNGIPQYKNVVRVTGRDLSSMILDLTAKQFKK